jgi:gentisate 1,2-dioxygenase
MVDKKLLQQFDGELAENGLEGHWMGGSSEEDKVAYEKDPHTFVLPHVWKWNIIYKHLMRAGNIRGLEGMAERRTLRLINPAFAKLPSRRRRATTHTVHMSVQLLKPGELASSHRHNFGAFRFIVEGRGAYTVVEGEKFVMEPGDLILNPPMTWHGHGGGDEPIVWLDGLDYPLLNSLQVITWEPFPGDFQPIKDSSKLTAHRVGMARPVWEKAAGPLAYKWDETHRTLKSLEASEGSPFDGVMLEYVNPVNGGHTFPTMSCGIQMLRKGEATRTHRHNSSTVYHAFRGSGVTLIDGKKYEWEQGDCFVVPLWSWHSHQNNSKSEEAILFSMNDQPMLEALKLYREEPGEGPRA